MTVYTTERRGECFPLVSTASAASVEALREEAANLAWEIRRQQAREALRREAGR